MDEKEKKKGYSLPDMSSLGDLDTLDVSKVAASSPVKSSKGSDEFGIFGIDFDSALGEGKFDKKEDDYKIIKKEDLVIAKEKPQEFYDPLSLEKPATITDFGEDAPPDLSGRTELFLGGDTDTDSDDYASDSYYEETVKFQPTAKDPNKKNFLPDMNMKYGVSFTDIGKTSHVVAKNEARVYIPENAFVKEPKEPIKKTLEVTKVNVTPVFHDAGGFQNSNPYSFIDDFNENSDFFANKMVSNISIPTSPGLATNLEGLDKLPKRNFKDYENILKPNFKSNQNIDPNKNKAKDEKDKEKEKEKEKDEDKDFVDEINLQLSKGAYKVLCRSINNAKSSTLFGYDFQLVVNRENGLSFDMQKVFDTAEKNLDLQKRLDQALILRTCRVASSPTRKKAGMFCATISNGYFFSDSFSNDIVTTMENLLNPPKELYFDFNETVLMDNVELTKVRFKFLQSLGVKISISGFGNKVFEYSKIPDFDISAVRISSELVKDYFENYNSRNVIYDIIAYSKIKNSLVIAMGISDTKQRESFLGLGCNLMQGKASLPEELPKPKEKTKTAKKVIVKRRRPSNQRAISRVHGAVRRRPPAGAVRTRSTSQMPRVMQQVPQRRHAVRIINGRRVLVPIRQSRPAPNMVMPRTAPPRRVRRPASTMSAPRVRVRAPGTFSTRPSRRRNPYLR